MHKDFRWIDKLEKDAKKALTATIKKEKLSWAKPAKAAPLKLQHPTLDKILERKLQRENRNNYL